MEFNAFKMDGLGNDFVIIDQRDETIDLTKEQIVKICNRDFIGCDQLIYIENSKVSDASMKFLTPMEAHQEHVEMEQGVLHIWLQKKKMLIMLTLMLVTIF